MMTRIVKVVDGIVTEIVEASAASEGFVEVPQDVACGVGYTFDGIHFWPAVIPCGYRVAGGFTDGRH
jgi:hypothetical protein